ncbi:redoxin domain-containing protein, partial [Klebsiella pneumoniae]|nr:redoxin domain-containing protein [Klebsiella pneumoniae]
PRSTRALSSAASDVYKRQVKDWRITYPVVADNEYAIWNAFGNQYWPAHYIFDARGQLRLSLIHI